MQGVRLYKYHGAGNDFLIRDTVADGEYPTFEQLQALAPSLCARYTGIGADGLLVLDQIDGLWRMRVINSDGSCAQMCGNGSRCVARHLFERHGVQSGNFDLITGRGTLKISINSRDSEFMDATVDMGPPILDAPSIPVIADIQADPLRLALPTEYRTPRMPEVIDGSFAAVSMGNPHAIFIVDDLSNIEIQAVGPVLETASVFPQRANIHFAQVRSRTKARIVTWERGAGATLACGTGACATLVALHLKGLLERTADIQVPGGTLSICWRKSDGHVMMTGRAAFVAVVNT